MAKEICISSTPHETRLAILEDDQLTEVYYERENEYTLAGSIYKGRVTRVLPGMQSAFVDLGLERDAFLYVTDFMEEQEDSADFDTNGSEAGRREPPAGREVSQARPPRENGRESRPPRLAAPVDQEAEEATESGSATHAAESVRKDGEFGEGTRRWRGRRGRRRGGRPHIPRESGFTSTPETRNSEPTSDIEIEIGEGPTVYEETISPGSGQAVFSERVAPLAPAAPQPPPPRIVLPGESLSRYGGKAAESPRSEARSATASATPVSTYKPSTLVEVVATWDGGVELPGESLSKHRGKAAVAPPPPTPELVEHAWSVPHSEHSIAEHDDRYAPVAISEIEQLPEIESTETHEEPAVEHAAAPADPMFGEPATPEALTVGLPATQPHAKVGSTVKASSPEQAEPDEAPTPGVEDRHIEDAHFEPANASASYRIDPVAPSEYRVSSVLEEEPEVHTPALDSEPVVPEDAVTHSQPEHTLAHHQPSHEEFIESAPVELGHVEHDEIPEATSVVYEDKVASTAQDEQTQSHHPDLAHEAISAPTGSSAEEVPHISETSFLDDDEFEDGPRGFAPGLGTLEEEVIDEEEYDSEPIRAYLDDPELDDLEEETLDNLAGAELGEMVRDTHLEQRINVSSAGIAIEEEEADYNESESDLEYEDEQEEVSDAQPSTSAPARRDGRTDDFRRGGRGPRRRGRPNGGGGNRRANAQLSDLPIISELLKQGQEILVQIAKEPIAKKGARITSHIALPGRFLVFMPTVNHVGVSRKISSDEERQRLKRILISERGAASGGFIVRTAADGASEDDLRADIRFLISLWNDIKQRSDEAKAPALIYHDLNLVERVLRDQVSANFSTIWVDNESDYERIVRFLNRFEPSLVRRVKLYTKETPLFEQFGIQDEISKALKSKVWLKSGGSIVINQTEALVAIDINTGKYVGKTARLEDTILKTNLDAIPEIVRQIRLRDLGGIIVIDFIDMDDRRNRHKVMAALEEELKHDRAPSKVLQFNDFGLVAITRKRVKQSLERTLSVQCEICVGTGMVKSPTTVCNEIYTELRKMQKHLERGDVLLRVHPEVVKILKANNAKWLNELEELTAKTIIVKSDPALHPEQFDIH
jgi:ribonuclease G